MGFLPSRGGSGNPGRSIRARANEVVVVDNTIAGEADRLLYERLPAGYASREGCVVELRVDLGPDWDQDASELDEAARQLRRELLQFDVDDVQRVQEGSPPPGARAVDVAMLGSLAVTAGQDVIGAVVRAIVQWIGRKSDRSVKLTIGEDSIELSDVSAEDQRKLVESFLARHATEA